MRQPCAEPPARTSWLVRRPRRSTLVSFEVFPPRPTADPADPALPWLRAELGRVLGARPVGFRRQDLLGGAPEIREARDDDLEEPRA